MAERSYQKSLERRDIGKIPPIENPARRALARKNLRCFCEEYFPKRFKLSWAKFHLEVIDRFERAILDGGKVSLAMPRGTGKTTLAEAAALWAVLYGFRRFFLITAANKGEAKKVLDALKAAVSENKRLLEDFPEAVYPFKKLGGSAHLARGQMYLGELTNIGWNSSELVFPNIPGSPASGAKIATVGINGAIRGKSTELPDGTKQRPDFVLIDDPQTEKTAASPRLVEKMEDIVNKGIEGLVGPGEELAEIATVTVIQEDDFADRLLDRKRYPQWNGLRFSAVPKMPERMDLWEKYREIKKDSAKEATEFYRENREEMDRGSEVSWPENFNRRKELSALQAEMNRWCDNEASFFSERQNAPLRPGSGTILVPPKEIIKRLNGLERSLVPMEAQRLTAFIDVHDDLFYYAITAWAEDFTGYVIDYGVYPEQSARRIQFSKSDKTLFTLAKKFPNLKTDSAILEGLTELIKQIVDRQFEVDEETDDGLQNTVYVERLLVDCGFKWRLVEQAIDRAVAKNAAKPSKGEAHGAKDIPIAEMKRKGSIRSGNFWYEDNVRGRSKRVVSIDTNYWKEQVHASLARNVGERGGLSFWGMDRNVHRMIADHLNAEAVTLVEAKGRKINEWKAVVKDNHLFDCVVGCFAAASTIGIDPGEKIKARPKRRDSGVINLDE